MPRTTSRRGQPSAQLWVLPDAGERQLRAAARRASHQAPSEAPASPRTGAPYTAVGYNFKSHCYCMY